MTMMYQKNITYSYHMDPLTLVSISGYLCKGISHYGYVYTPMVICMHTYKSLTSWSWPCTVGDY